ncbi:MAG: GTP pyrophosphokinase family protein [Clostridia bacterium]|nr:GTP pyrophosphokinase family protein [Clostridia bacterium]
MMNATNSIYGARSAEMESVMHALADCIRSAAAEIKEKTGMNPVEHLKYRIKAEDSMREKCRRQGLPETTESALQHIHDAIGLRVVCTFLDDVYAIRDYLRARDDLEIVNEKDYIRSVKSNGYRSLHLIVKKDGYYAEIQIRTISMDTWAALEHQIRYKKNVGNSALIFEELKRCADELASTDVSMQIIRAAINEKDGEA